MAYNDNVSSPPHIHTCTARIVCPSANQPLVDTLSMFSFALGSSHSRNDGYQTLVVNP